MIWFKPGLIKFFGCYLRNYLLLLEANTSNNDQNQLLQRFLPFLFDILLQSDPSVYIVIGLGEELLFPSDRNTNIICF